MYLHLGQETVVKTSEIIGIFDLDTSTISSKTREFLAKSEANGQVVNTSTELPKSFVVRCDKNKKINKIYICQNMASTIKKRQNII